MEIKRVVSWFSCGATSAIATKITIEKYKDKYPIVVAYCDTGSEHPDNVRFLHDCEKWFDYPITILKNEKFTDVFSVWDASGYIAGIYGAKCSTELKKKLRQMFEDLNGDLQIFGFDRDEESRSERFKANNPEVTVEFPLIERKLSKAACIFRLHKAQIELPEMYKMGYINNNCIGCVKGGAGYWNKIRKDFPEIFAKTAEYEKKYNVRLLASTVDGEKTRIFLDELHPKAGNYKSELPIQCGFFCGEI